MGDHIVELSCYPGPLFDDRLPGNQVPFPLCDLRASLPVADDATDEQHHDQRDDCERHASFRPAPYRDRRERRQRHRRRAERKQPRRRPDRQGVQRAQPGDAEAHDVGRFPRNRNDVGDKSGRDTRSGGIPATDRNSARHHRTGDRDYEPLPLCDAAEPRLELGHDGEPRREDDVEPGRGDPEATETQKACGHALKVDGPERRVISRSADPAASQDPPIG